MYHRVSHPYTLQSPHVYFMWFPYFPVHNSLTGFCNGERISAEPWNVKCKWIINWLHGAESFVRSIKSLTSKEIPRILCYPKVHHRIHQRPPPVPILNQISPVHASPFYFLKRIILNYIILSSTSKSSKWFLSLRSLHQTPIYISTVSHTCYMVRPSHSSWFPHPYNILWQV